MKYTKYSSSSSYREILLNDWKLPNISSFKILNYKYDKFLSELGIFKKIRKLFFVESQLNVKNNKYLKHCQKLLIKQIGFCSNSKYYVRNHFTSRRINWGFWVVARKIILFNKSYLIKHLLKSNSKLNRDQKVSSLRELIHGIYVKVGNARKSLIIPMRRKWIQAPAPKCRSLTIPRLVDRIIASMWTEMLELYLKGSINRGHHGYQENKGCNTAWIDLLRKQDKYSYIYEFDLCNFFPSVSHSILFKILKDLGIPSYMIIYFLLPLQAKPDLDMELEVPDYQTGKESVWFKSIYEKINYKGESNYVLGKAVNIGVPMGLGYSPLLAIMVLGAILDIWKSHGNDFVTYADDGILLTNNASDIIKFKELCEKFGLAINESKSRFIRQEGKINEYKFLGLVYKDGLLSSQTRKGFSADLLVDAMEIINKGYFGTILSRLYGSVDIIDQNFHLWWSRGSVMSKVTGYHNEDNRLWLRKTSALWSVLHQSLVATLSYVRRFSTSSVLRASKIKWSGMEWEDQIEWYNLNVFNHSTYASNWLVEECYRIAFSLNKNVFDLIPTVIATYEERWKEQVFALRCNVSDIILETPDGPIYQSQVGKANFQAIVKEYGDDYAKSYVEECNVNVQEPLVEQEVEEVTEPRNWSEEIDRDDIGNGPHTIRKMFY